MSLCYAYAVIRNRDGAVVTPAYLDIEQAERVRGYVVHNTADDKPASTYRVAKVELILATTSKPGAEQ